MTSSNGNGPREDRRAFLKTAGLGAVGAVAGAAHGKFALAPISPAQAQVAASALSQQKWWPSKWGADDEAGASNHITPEKVLDTIKSIKDGKTYKLGRVYEAGMPLFGQRAFVLRIPGGPTGGPFGANKLVYHDEFLATEIGQTGTQFDGLGHIGVQLGKDGDKTEMHFYNGFTAAEISDAVRPEETRRGEAEAAVHPRPPHRHGGTERRHDGRRPGDHCRRYPCRPAEAEHAGE